MKLGADELLHRPLGVAWALLLPDPVEHQVAAETTTIILVIHPEVNHQWLQLFSKIIFNLRRDTLRKYLNNKTLKINLINYLFTFWC